jgi:hypothetical protein
MPFRKTASKTRLEGRVVAGFRSCFSSWATRSYSAGGAPWLRIGREKLFLSLVAVRTQIFFCPFDLFVNMALQRFRPRWRAIFLGADEIAFSIRSLREASLISLRLHNCPPRIANLSGGERQTVPTKPIANILHQHRRRQS